MSIFREFQLFLFDCDGLLVDTEKLHFRSFLKMCLDRGCVCTWSFEHYCEMAHTSREGLKQATYRQFPTLLEEEPSWEVLYEERKKAYLDILKSEEVELMPGVEPFLALCEENNVLRCVVTNSRKKEIEIIKAKCPLLDSIPHWVTREDYTQPKPHPEPYLIAKQRLGITSGQAIGFEDSLRGIESLKAAGVTPILISTLVESAHFPSFVELLKSNIIPA